MSHIARARHIHANILSNLLRNVSCRCVSARLGLARAMSAPSSGEGLTKCHPLTGDAPLHKGATKSGTIEGAAQTIEGAAQLTQKANEVLK